MSHAAPAILAPLTGALPAFLIKQQQDARKAAQGLINTQKSEADQAAADVKARQEADDKRRAMLGQIAQRSLMSGFNRSSNYGGTLLTSGSGGQSTILGA